MARWGAVVTAGWLQLPNRVWAGAGQADSTAAALVVGADGGGRAGGDAAAAGNTASHGVGSVVCLLFLGDEVSELQMPSLALSSYIPSPVGVGPTRRLLS